MIEALVPLFERADVRLVLAGHEHNFQIGQVGRRTYLLSGAGGKVRDEAPQRLGESGVDAWAAHSHLVVAELSGEEVRLTPVTGLRPDGELQLLTAQTADKRLRRAPFVVDGRP
jgi:hypothetical protein